MEDAILAVTFCLSLVLAGSFLLAALFTFAYSDPEPWDGRSSKWEYLQRRWPRCSRQVLRLLYAGLGFAALLIGCLVWAANLPSAHRPNQALQPTAGAASVPAEPKR